MSLGTWGDVVFEVSADLMRTWQDMKRSGEARWARHEVYAGKPLPEFIGPGLDSLTMSVRLDALRGVTPADEIKTLREQRDIGAVHPLMIGGELVFDCTLKSIGEDHRRHDAMGKPLLIIAELSFEEYT